MNKNLLYLGFSLLLSTSCQQAANEEQVTSSTTAPASITQEFPSFFKEVLQAHGGVKKWNEMGTMKYQLTSDGKTETHTIDLKNRKSLVQAENYSLGFDGEQVWVSPNKSAFPGGSARFYHNLYFYFSAIPLVLADPGVNYEQMDDMVLQGNKFNVIGISFSEGIGNSPQDKYRLLVNPETKRLEWLLHTVTFFDGKPSDKFNALKYEDYQEHQGLLFPTKLVGYKYENGEIGDQRFSATFKNLNLKKEQPDQQQFVTPEGAEIDSMATI